MQGLGRASLFSDLPHRPLQYGHDPAGDGTAPGGGTKAETAFALAKTYCRAANLAYDFILTSALPQGKGMASSSADVCAVLAAVGLVSGRQLSEQEIGRLAASIEPTDGIFCPGFGRHQPRYGIIKTVLGPVPKLSIAVFDAGGTVDTVAFHERGRRGLSDSKASKPAWPSYNSL